MRIFKLADFFHFDAAGGMKKVPKLRILIANHQKMVTCWNWASQLSRKSFPSERYQSWSVFDGMQANRIA